MRTRDCHDHVRWEAKESNGLPICSSLFTVWLEMRRCHRVLRTGLASFCRSLCSCKSLAPLVCSLYDVSGAWIVAFGMRMTKMDTSSATTISAAEHKNATW